jgi:hypothetical protein
LPKDTILRPVRWVAEINGAEPEFGEVTAHFIEPKRPTAQREIVHLDNEKVGAA